jgi:hypothetical protein
VSFRLCGGWTCTGAGRWRRRRGQRRRCRARGWRRGSRWRSGGWHVCAQPATSWTMVVLPGDERDTAGVCCGRRRRQRGPKARQTANASSRASCESVGDGGSEVSAGDAQRLLAVWRGVRAETPSRGARCLKGDAPAAAAKRCFFEAGVGTWRDVAARVGARGLAENGGLGRRTRQKKAGRERKEHWG